MEAPKVSYGLKSETKHKPNWQASVEHLGWENNKFSVKHKQTNTPTNKHIVTQNNKQQTNKPKATHR